jgi:hypothetical protein
LTTTYFTVVEPTSIPIARKPLKVAMVMLDLSLLLTPEGDLRPIP